MRYIDSGAIFPHTAFWSKYRVSHIEMVFFLEDSIKKLKVRIEKIWNLDQIVFFWMLWSWLTKCLVTAGFQKKPFQYETPCNTFCRIFSPVFAVWSFSSFRSFIWSFCCDCDISDWDPFFLFIWKKKNILLISTPSFYVSCEIGIL